MYKGHPTTSCYSKVSLSSPWLWPFKCSLLLPLKQLMTWLLFRVPLHWIAAPMSSLAVEVTNTCASLLTAIQHSGAVLGSSPRSLCLSQGGNQCCVSWSGDIGSITESDLFNAAEVMFNTCIGDNISGWANDVSINRQCLSQCLSNRPNGCWVQSNRIYNKMVQQLSVWKIWSQSIEFTRFLFEVVWCVTSFIFVLLSCLCSFAHDFRECLGSPPPHAELGRVVDDCLCLPFQTISLAGFMQGDTQSIASSLNGINSNF